MLDFIKKIYGGLIVILIWVCLIGFVIIGGMVSGIFGIIIGLIVGFILVIIFGGLAATVLSMDERLGEIENVLNQLGQTTPASEWVCKKCGNTNRKTALFCNSCGEQK